MYVRPQAAGTLKDASRRKHFAEECARLNALPQVDYEAATALKEQYMRELYAQSGQRQMKTEEFKAFASANENWLRPYAAWRALRDRFDTPDHSQWEEYAVYDEEAILRFCTDNAEETGFFFSSSSTSTGSCAKCAISPISTESSSKETFPSA